VSDPAICQRSPEIPDWVRDAVFYQIFPERFCKGVGEQRSSYGTRSITALMESATLWKVDATEAGPRADLGLERLP
jgi:hypothetical protein